MEIKRILYKPKVRRLFNLNSGICYIELRGSVYFLENYKSKSLDFLRKVTDFLNKKPTEFYEIIHKNYLKECEKTEKTYIKKKPYYAKMRIQRAKERIIKLKENIKIEEDNLNKLNGGEKWK